ncbi:MAG: DUF3291 domain-containing protein [Solirubrobacterales bacterium]|nr:DUF3291 domain-containing protein [Solirubrobacterales bacterium]
MRPRFHLAHVNIALARAPFDSDLLSEFMARLDPINALADRRQASSGACRPEDGNSIAVRGFDNDRMIVNLSVWESIDHLTTFVYRSAHTEIMRRRREWFDRTGVHLALWWVPAGHLPTVAEAEERLAHLRKRGPTPYAFTFNRRFLGVDRLEINAELGCPA